MPDLFSERIYGIPWVALAAAASVVALAYVFFPDRGSLAATGVRWFALRWFRTIAWVFLGLAGLARSKVTKTPVEYAAPLAATGGLVYVVLMLTTLVGEG